MTIGAELRIDNCSIVEVNFLWPFGAVGFADPVGFVFLFFPFFQHRRQAELVLFQELLFVGEFRFGFFCACLKIGQLG